MSIHDMTWNDYVMYRGLLERWREEGDAWYRPAGYVVDFYESSLDLPENLFNRTRFDYEPVVGLWKAPLEETYRIDVLARRGARDIGIFRTLDFRVALRNTVLYRQIEVNE